MCSGLCSFFAFIVEWCLAVLSFSGTVPQNECFCILLIGHSYIFWAAKFAARSSWGQNLGLRASALLHWRGRQEMCRAEFLDVAVREAQGWSPDVLLVHLGGNDLSM